MNKKPSERIKEIMVAMAQEKGNHWTENKIGGIWEYLDEEWDKNQPCKHKGSYQVDGINDVYYNVCNNCGVLFLATKEDEKI